MDIRKRLLVLSAWLASIVVASSNASALQIINFPDVTTPNLVYSSLEEANNSIIAGQSLFAGVSNNGDTLRLQSTAFTVSKVGGIDFLAGNFDATITASDSLTRITGITVTENGSATVFGVNSLAFLTMEASVIPSADATMMDLTTFTKTGVAGPPDSSTWMRSISFKFAPSDEVLFSLRNELLVDGSTGLATIGKDKVVIQVHTTTIPEPTSALALAVMGVAGVAVRRRRR